MLRISRAAAVLICLLPTLTWSQEAVVVWSALSTRATNDRNVKNTEALPYPIASHPFISSDTVVCSFPDREILGINNPTGKRIWVWPWILDQDQAIPKLRRQKGNAPKPPHLKLASALSHDHKGGRVATVDSEGQGISFSVQDEGKLAWRFYKTLNQPAPRILGPPCFVDDRAFCLFSKNNNEWELVELDAGTGQELRQIDLPHADQPTPEVAYTPVSCDSMIVIPFPSGKLLGIRRSNLTVAWSHQTDSKLNAPFHMKVLDAQLLLLKQPHCYCVDGETGDRAWKLEGVQTTPFIAHTDLVVLGTAESLSAHRLSDGQQEWSTKRSDQDQLSGNGTVADTSLLLPINSTAIHQYDLSTGKLQAKFGCSIPVQHLFQHDRYLYSLSAVRITKFLLPGITNR